METLITFYSKYGTASTSAEYLSGKIRGSLVINLQQNEPNIDSFKNIIVGGAIYDGKLCAPVKRFLQANQNKFKDKKLFIYINSLTVQSFHEVKSRDIPQKFADSTQKIIFAGGMLPSRISLIDRFRFSSVSGKIKGLSDFKIDYTALDEIANEL